MFYKCRHFRIEELVDQFTFNKFGELSWMFFDPNALRMIDGLREYFDTPIYINGWLWKSESQFRGLRPRYYAKGVTHSPHHFGKAFDMTFKGMTADEVRNRIINDQDHPHLNFINRIEAKVNWIHADTMNIPDDQRIRVVYP